MVIVRDRVHRLHPLQPMSAETRMNKPVPNLPNFRSFGYETTSGRPRRT